MCIHIRNKDFDLFEKRESTDQETDPKLPFKNIFETCFFIFSEPS
jgi:hypothetical protein